MLSRMLNRIIAIVFLGGVFFGTAAAQDAPARVLQAGQLASGTLSAEQIAQIFTLAGNAGEKFNIAVAVDQEVALAMVIADSTGAIVAQATSIAGSTISVMLPQTDTYYLTVFPSSGALTEPVTFQIALDLAAVATTSAFKAPTTIVTQTGVQISLSWSSTANLDLEVRDSVGGSLRFATPTVNSGGAFGVNVNSACNTVTANNPTETANWPAGEVSTGSYELLVYYQPVPDCPTSDPVNFTLSASVDGRNIQAFTGSLLPNQIYLASFRIGEDGVPNAGLSGIRQDPPTTQGVRADSPIPLTSGIASQGAIVSQTPYTTYTFAAEANDVVSIGLNALSGSLDPLLLILDPNGQVLAINDDADVGVTNSAVNNLVLIVPGTYTVIATRYGQDLGGTEGDYELTFTAQTAANQADSTVLSGLTDLPTGSLAFSLQWTTNAELQLLVRDPQGDTVYNTKPSIPSGGQLTQAGNQACTNVTENPLSYIYWPEGRLPAGSYEVEVQYRSQCADTRPVTFTLNAIANGRVVLSRTQQLLLEERYVTSLEVTTDGQVTAGDGGLFGTVKRPDSASLDYLAEIETAQIINSNETLQGAIRLNKKFAVYVFDGTPGQIVTIGMNRVSGTLDPVLFLISPNGEQAAENDDANGETRDSLINQFILREEGRYIIIATHFGARYGVTAGDFSLTMRLS